MTPWLFFALLAPLLWAMTNVIDAAVRRHFVKSDLAFTWLVAVSRLPFVVLFFWIGGVEIPNASIILLMLMAGMLWTFPLLLYFKAIEFEEPSRVALFFQFTPIFTLLIASFAIQERLTSNQTAAFVLLIAGGALAAVKHLKGVWHFSKAFFLIALAGFLWATSDVFFKKFELSFSGFFAAFAVYFLGSFLVSVVMLFHPHGRRKILKHFVKLPARAWWMLGLTQTAGIGGSIAFAYALTLGKASLTAVMMGIQPLFTLIFGVILSRFIREIHKEDLGKKTLILKSMSFVLILLGLVALQLSFP